MQNNQRECENEINVLPGLNKTDTIFECKKGKIVKRRTTNTNTQRHGQTHTPSIQPTLTLTRQQILSQSVVVGWSCLTCNMYYKLQPRQENVLNQHKIPYIGISLA